MKSDIKSPPPPLVFDMLQYFEKISPLVQDEVYISWVVALLGTFLRHPRWVTQTSLSDFFSEVSAVQIELGVPLKNQVETP